jgi:hypothetical protein
MCMIQTMEVHPWLPPFTQSNQFGFPEATTSGSKFVEIVREPFAPLHSYDNALASPFRNSLVCECGSRTVDGVCAMGKQIPSGPFWQPATRPRFQMEPYELIPSKK